MKHNKFWLSVAGLTIAAMLLGACAPQPTPTPQMVEVTRIVEVAGETRIEKEVVVVTATPQPQPKQPSVFRFGGWWATPPAFTGNRFAGGWSGAAFFYWEPLFTYVPDTGELFMRLAESVTEGDNSVTVKLRKGVVWHDGQPFTSKDVWCSIALNGWMHGSGVGRTLSMETPDDYTIVFSWEEPPAFPLVTLANEMISEPYHIFGDYCSKVPDLIGDDEAMGALREELHAFAPEKPVGTGPFQVANVTEAEFVMTKFADYYLADKIGFDQAIMLTGANEVIWALLMADEIDAAHPSMTMDVHNAIMKQQPGMKMALPSDWAEFSLMFNTRKPPFDKVEVRKAIAYIVDRAEVIEVSNPFAGPTEYSTGLIASQEGKWLDQAAYGRMTHYTPDAAKAEALLLEAGWRKDANGAWLDASGAPAALQLDVVAGWSDWVLACENIAQQITEFGIPTECMAQDGSVYWPGTMAGDYQMMISFYAIWWGTYSPWGGFNDLVNGDQGVRMGLFDNPEVMGPDGTTINLKDLVDKLAVASTEAERKELIQMLAWAFNENVPALAFLEKKLPIHYNTAHINWPDENDPLWSTAGGGIDRCYASMMIAGKLSPK